MITNNNQFTTDNTLHKKLLPNSHSLQNIFRIMDSRRIPPARQVTRGRKGGRGGGERERDKALVNMVLNPCIKYETSWPPKRLSVQNPLRSSQIVSHA
jgi:hypothetical protein